MNRNPLNLDFRESGYKCNARTPTGYCKNRAGFKTTHVGDGRCYLHGGNLPATNNSFQSIYTKMLPTNLAIELAEIKHDPTFTTLFSEYALLKLIVQVLLRDLPVDLSSMYGRLKCDKCKHELNEVQDVIWVEYPKYAGREQKRLKELVSTIEAMSRVFEKMSKHEERQKRFIKVSEIEQLMVQWGKIIMKHLGDDPRLQSIQKDLLECGFVRMPDGEQDEKKLNKFREIQKEAYNKTYSHQKKSMADAMNEVFAKEVNYEIIIENNKNNGNRKYKWNKSKNKKRRKIKHDGIYIEQA